MKFSESWLRRWVDPAVTTETLVEQLTMAGLEVDAVTPVAGEFSGVVVGEILTVEQHPDADKLRVCTVAGGEQPVQVVCGAPNARAGIKVAFATVGARLPGELVIRKAKLRGVESFGMLCGADELGIEAEGDGLLELAADAAVGSDLRACLDLDDKTIELGLTPNRADCLGLRGIAREVAVLNGLAVESPDLTDVIAASDVTLPVSVVATEDCPRYVGRVIRNVDVSRPSPTWLVERLRRSGLRPIDAVVDVTNYVMLELGQPLHAFDLDRLRGGIVVRGAATGEQLEMLDGQTLELRSGDLVIADHEEPLALAGIMGGRPSAVSVATSHIFLESAFFAPHRIAGRARAYGLHTDSSHRFERGVDFDLQAVAMARATRLLLDIVGGEAGPLIEETSALPHLETIALRPASVTRMLGMELPAAEVETILDGLGMRVASASDGWYVTPPSWRFDVRIEADLLEELARVYGYNRLPTRPINADLPLSPQPERHTGIGQYRRALAARGYQEAITYSFVDPALQERLEPGAVPVTLRNPIASDMAVMRTTLWAGLLKTLQYNLNRQQSRVRLFESGLRFLPGSDGLRQAPALALLATGARLPEGWSNERAAVDFFDIKGDVEALIALAGLERAVTFAAGAHPALHPGQTAAVLRDGRPVGMIGALHPELQRELGIEQAVYLAEVALTDLSEGELPRFSALSRYPAVRRDLAVLAPLDLPVQALLDAVRASAGQHLRDVNVFDVYQGKGIDPQRKSIAMGLTFQDSSRTLAEDEIGDAIGRVTAQLASQFGATLRN